MKAIIFDFYNTLAWIGQKKDLYPKLIKQANQSEIKGKNWSKWIMTNEFESLDDIFGNLGINEQVLHNAEIELQKEIESVQLYREVEKVLEKLSTKRELYLLSNLASQYKAPFYRLRLNRWISKAFFSCEIGLLKPSKEIFEYVLNVINKNPSEVIMVGDSYRSDIVGAKNCGIDSIWIRRTKEAGGPYIQSLNELEVILKK